MLAQHEVVAYLLRRGLLNTSAVVADGVTVLDISRRNLNFAVVTPHGPHLLLKQGVGPRGRASIAREAATYARLSRPASSRFTAASVQDSPVGWHDGHDPAARHNFLPGFCDYDAEEGVLAVEWIEGAATLSERFARLGRFSAALAADLGEQLARLHGWHGWRDGAGGAPDPSAHLWSDDGTWPPVCEPPGILSLHRPTVRTLRELSSASLDIVKLIQRAPALCALLDRLRVGWAPLALIHGDVRWDNCLVAPSEPHGRPALKLVDWELAGAGDPRWDLGSVFASYLGTWLWSLPLGDGTLPAHFLEHARFPLEAMQPAMRAFWRTYARRMQLDAPTADIWLLESLAFATARLLQVAYERLQFSVRLTASEMYLAQFCQNLALRPHEAVVHVLGIPLGAEATGQHTAPSALPSSRERAITRRPGRGVHRA